MNAEELREQYRNSPEWAFVGMMVRLAQVEAKIEELTKPKRKPRKKVNGSR